MNGRRRSTQSGRSFSRSKCSLCLSKEGMASCMLCNLFISLRQPSISSFITLLLAHIRSLYQSCLVYFPSVLLFFVIIALRHLPCSSLSWFGGTLRNVTHLGFCSVKLVLSFTFMRRLYLLNCSTTERTRCLRYILGTHPCLTL